MKTTTAKTAANCPPYLAELTKISPSIAFSVTRQIDPSYRWDGDGPDPVDDGFDAYDVDVTARAIVNGQIVEGSESLGGSYYRPDEPTGEAHGYLPQMLDGAAKELGELLNRRTHQTGDTADQIAREVEKACAYLRKVMHERYEAQRAEIEKGKR